MSDIETDTVRKRKLSRLNPRLRKKLKQERNESLSPEEVLRRDKQRQLRDLALKLRAEGKVYKKARYARLRAETLASALSDDLRPKKKKEKKLKKTKPPPASFQVVIIPIFWNQRKDEKQRVVSAAEKIQQLLTDHEVSCSMDTRDHNTPGQKMKYWEERGVRVRVEVGPNEALARQCVVAVCKAPGEVANRRTVKVDAELLPTVSAALERPETLKYDAPKLYKTKVDHKGDEKLGGDGSADREKVGKVEEREKRRKRKDSSEDDDSSGKQKKKRKEKEKNSRQEDEGGAGDAEAEDMFELDADPSESDLKLRGAARFDGRLNGNSSGAGHGGTGGDDLEDDFGADVLLEAEAVGKQKKKKKPLSSVVDVRGDVEQPKGKSKKHRVVSF